MPEHVHSLTDAPLSHSAEQRSRIISYSVSMGIRIVCFIMAAITAFIWESWWAWVFVVGAVVLPYTAVVQANVGGSRYGQGRENADGPQHQLEGGRAQIEALTDIEAETENNHDDDVAPDSSSETIVGEVVTDDQTDDQTDRPDARDGDR